MVFSSILFICLFFPVTITVCLLLPARWRNAFLLAASLVFYAWGEPKYLLLMAATALVDYFAGHGIGRLQKLNKKRAAKTVLALCVTLNLLSLCFFKYTGFILKNVSSLLGLQSPVFAVALPVGISFYTFQTLSYVIDVYRGRVRVQKNFVDFFMFVTIFPQLIAGPIVRYSEIEPELTYRPLHAAEFANGVLRFCVGLGKKVVLANSLGQIFNSGIAAQDSFLTVFTACLAFMLQIYFDFSGYSDMAIGMGLMLGFHFPENFNYPYESVSITDFWRRWHKTLSAWFLEYLYIPLGGNRKGKARQIFNLFVVWALTGLWHGADWNFLLWGLYFFVILVAEKLFLLRLLAKLPTLLRHLYALLLVFLGWVLFSANGLGGLLATLRALFGGAPFASGTGCYLLVTALPLFALSAVAATHYPKALLLKLKGRAQTALAQNGLLLLQGAGAFLLLLLSLALLTGDSYNPFLYFRF